MYIDQELVFNSLTFENQEELFDFVSQTLEEKGYVKSTFNNAIKNREKKYPTGIEINSLNIALCHTDAEHVNINKIMVLKLRQPVDFKSMETLEYIGVNIVFILLLNNPELHLEVLQTVSTILQNKEYLKSLEEATSKEKLYGLLKDKIIIS